MSTKIAAASSKRLFYDMIKREPTMHAYTVC